MDAHAPVKAGVQEVGIFSRKNQMRRSWTDSVCGAARRILLAGHAANVMGGIQMCQKVDCWGGEKTEIVSWHLQIDTG